MRAAVRMTQEIRAVPLALTASVTDPTGCPEIVWTMNGHAGAIDRRQHVLANGGSGSHLSFQWICPMNWRSRHKGPSLLANRGGRLSNGASVVLGGVGSLRPQAQIDAGPAGSPKPPGPRCRKSLSRLEVAHTRPLAVGRRRQGRRGRSSYRCQGVAEDLWRCGNNVEDIG